MNTNTICLWWYDANWKSKGAAEHVVATIDFESKCIKTNVTYIIPQGINCLEVKRKSDLLEYVETLIKAGFRKVK